MNKKKQVTLADTLKAYAPVKVPYEVHRVIGAANLLTAGNQASLDDNGDFVQLSELRHAIEWYVKQLNGKVDWYD